MTVNELARFQVLSRAHARRLLQRGELRRSVGKDDKPAIDEDSDRAYLAAEAKMNLEDRVMRSIVRRHAVVILRSELARLGSPAQLSRVLAKLVSSGALVRVSRGVYAKTRFNRFTGRPAPAATFEEIASEVFRKLGIDIAPGKLANDYNAGKTTQIPMLAVVNTGRRRISRKIQVGSRIVIYERAITKGRQPAEVADDKSHAASGNQDNCE